MKRLVRADWILRRAHVMPYHPLNVVESLHVGSVLSPPLLSPPFPPLPPPPPVPPSFSREIQLDLATRLLMLEKLRLNDPHWEQTNGFITCDWSETCGAPSTCPASWAMSFACDVGLLEKRTKLTAVPEDEPSRLQSDPSNAHPMVEVPRFPPCTRRLMSDPILSRWT